MMWNTVSWYRVLPKIFLHLSHALNWPWAIPSWNLGKLVCSRGCFVKMLTNSADPDQTAPWSSLIWIYIVFLGINVWIVEDKYGTQIQTKAWQETNSVQIKSCICWNGVLCHQSIKNVQPTLQRLHLVASLLTKHWNLRTKAVQSECRVRLWGYKSWSGSSFADGAIYVVMCCGSIFLAVIW